MISLINGLTVIMVFAAICTVFGTLEAWVWSGWLSALKAFCIGCVATLLLVLLIDHLAWKYVFRQNPRKPRI
jgi:uncharacterized membrane protein